MSSDEIGGIEHVFAFDFPSNITSLDLRENGFDLINKTQDFDVFFERFTRKLTSLNLGNALKGCSTYVFKFFDVSVLSLSEEGLEDTLKKIVNSKESIKDILSFSNLEVIKLENRAIYCNELLALWMIKEVEEELAKNVLKLAFKGMGAPNELDQEVLQYGTEEEFMKYIRGRAFEAIKLPREIDEKYLSQIINILEKQNTPIAFLTCGLLLQGRIENFVEDEKDDSYMEKRHHDAITYYVKAAEDPAIKPLVDFMLWHMKTCPEHYPVSIQKRLVEFDLTGVQIASHSSYKKEQTAGIALLYRSLGLLGTPGQQNNNAQNLIETHTSNQINDNKVEDTKKAYNFC